MLPEKLIKISTQAARRASLRDVSNWRRSACHGTLFAAILDRIARLAMPPPVVVDRKFTARYLRGGRHAARVARIASLVRLPAQSIWEISADSFYPLQHRASPHVHG